MPMDKPSNTPSANQQRAASEQRFSALVTATSDIIYSLSPDWRIMYELDGRGFLPDAPEPTEDWQVINVYAEDRKKVTKAINEAIADKKIFEMEHRVNRADGTVGWTFSRAVPILNEKGEITEWFGTASDITERKLAEQTLELTRKESEQQRRLYETITSATPDLMYVFDLNYRFTYANRALLNMWGKTWETSIGKNLLENGYEPWHAAMHEREIDYIVATKKPVRGEVSFPHATLGKREYDYILMPVFNAKGEVEAIAGTTRDVTDRKQFVEMQTQNAAELQAVNEEMAATNEELAASNEELVTANEQLKLLNDQLQTARQKIKEGEVALRLAIDAANFGTWFLHSKTREFVTDARLKELFGYYPDEDLTIEQALAQVSDEYRGYVAEKLENAINNRGDYDVTYPVTGFHDGRLRWVRAIGNLKADPSGTFSAFTGVVMDITEQKNDEIRKNDFIAMVSHELKTPLTSIKGYIQVVLRKLRAEDDGFIASAMERANIQVEKMTNMISGFLNISRLESGKIHISHEQFDLAELVKEAEEESLATISSHTVIFAPVKTTIINADRDKIGQVIHNLISNAVKYAPAGTKIEIACTNDAESACISIKDQGIGIRADDLPKIFDRYYRVENNNMSSISGFGIGLYLCKEIISRHQGKIWVESEFGKGSTFRFSLPKAKFNP